VSNRLSFARTVFGYFFLGPSKHSYQLAREHHAQYDQREHGGHESHNDLHQNLHASLLQDDVLATARLRKKPLIV
jgi:hypothetical protein